ncbi:Zinc finger MYM-type protein 1 [Linum grandiflorum]
MKRLALQGSAFRGHDESESSLNRGNLIEWLELLTEWREDVKAVVLQNAPGNAKYIAPSIQKEILEIMANRVRRKIREEVGDACFSILVDEAQDQAGLEQMAVILRFVNSAGILTERFFKVICDLLSEYNLQLHKIRGQGYDGASNMSGQYNGLKALFLQECPYAYFVHCFAHRLQLTLHMMRKIMMETMFLSQAFQRESVDILEAVGMVSTSKDLLQKLRDEGWEPLLEEVNSFCSKHDIDIPDLNMLGRRGMNKMPLEQLYHFEYFNQVRLLQLGAALDPRDSFSSFNADHIYELAVEFYPQDFADHEQLLLRSQLPYYERHVVRNSDFKVPSLAKLLEMLVTRRLEEQYTMICRLIRLLLTLPVSTATTERAFSAMKFVKNDLRTKMADGFLADSLLMFIERDYTRQLDVESTIDEFARLKNRRVQLKL